MRGMLILSHNELILDGIFVLRELDIRNEILLLVSELIRGKILCHNWICKLSFIEFIFE
jgi:hypothetical protein